MANQFFSFKQFTIWHDKCAMKVGTDGVLLGAWSRVETAREVLDIGTGTGLVALMIAQRSQAAITAVEIDADAVTQAGGNIARSPWKDRIKLVQADFREYRPETRYDAIVSNPPYFTGSLPCPDTQRTVARHNAGLTYHDLLAGVSRLLKEQGRFTVIIPRDAAEAMMETAATFGLYPCRALNVITAPGKPPKRCLLEFGFAPEPPCVTEELLIEEKRHQYSPGFIALTKDFFLSM